jgi:hypothetical protein
VTSLPIKLKSFWVIFCRLEPLWLSGKVMDLENKRNQKIPGSTPSPGNLKFFSAAV